MITTRQLSEVMPSTEQMPGYESGEQECCEGLPQSDVDSQGDLVAGRFFQSLYA